MTNIFKKLFGGIDLSWPKLIVSAVIAGVLTAVIALIPALHYTSAHTITVTFEVWILFGIIIIIEANMVHVDLRHSGDTVLTPVSPSGEKTEFDLHIERHTYEITEKYSGEEEK